MGGSSREMFHITMCYMQHSSRILTIILDPHSLIHHLNTDLVQGIETCMAVEFLKVHRKNTSRFDSAVPVLGEECVNKFDNRPFDYIFRGDY